MEEQALSSKNNPNSNVLDFNFDIDLENAERMKVTGEKSSNEDVDIHNLVDDPMRTNSGVASDEAAKVEDLQNVPPPLPPIMDRGIQKQSSSLKTSGDKEKKKKGALKVGFSINEQDNKPISVEEKKLNRQQTETEPG